MSRTVRSRIPLKKGKGNSGSIFRRPKHARALRYSKDEYGIRKGAIPPTNYDDLNYSSYSEDYGIKEHFASRRKSFS